MKKSQLNLTANEKLQAKINDTCGDMNKVLDVNFYFKGMFQTLTSKVKQCMKVQEDVIKKRYKDEIEKAQQAMELYQEKVKIGLL